MAYLANQGAHQATLERVRALAPKKFARLVQPKVETLPALKWKPLTAGVKAPPSKPDGNPFDVVFINRSGGKVALFWMDRTGGHKPYAVIAPGTQYSQQTRPGAVWMIAEAAGKAGKNLGYFEVGDRAARAVVPK